MSLIFGVKKFHKYLYGREFVLITDHKPLVTIFGPYSSVPTLAALRLQRWSLILMAYNYSIVHREGKLHSNVDMLSRFPNDKEHMCAEELKVNFFSYTDQLPISCDDIAMETAKDSILRKVYHFVMNGWTSNLVEDDLCPYFRRQHELSIENGCILWGMRVIIPSVFRDRLLNELHHEHIGIVKMKAVARSYFWYPKMDLDIENLVI